MAARIPLGQGRPGPFHRIPIGIGHGNEHDVGVFDAIHALDSATGGFRTELCSAGSSGYMDTPDGNNEWSMSMLSGSPVLVPILTPAAACGSAAFIRRLRISEPGAT